MSAAPDGIPDLKSLIAEASRPSASCSITLKQGLLAQIETLREELAAMPTTGPRRAGAASPHAQKQAQIDSLMREAESSTITLTFEAITKAQRDKIRDDMDGRDEPDEANLRVTAAMCSKIVGPDGVEYPDRFTWTDLRDLRDRIGVHAYDATIERTSDRASGVWSVPFSSSALPTHET